MAYSNRGIARKDVGDLAGAIEDYTRAIGLSARYGDAYSNRGLTRELLAKEQGARVREHLQAALADLERALEVSPRSWKYRSLAETALARVREALRKLESNDR